MRVRVYRNLKHGPKAPRLYSIMHNGRVIAHACRVMLRDVKFIVREGGRKRVLREKRKNVHAFIEGEWVSNNRPPSLLRLYAVPVRYNPYESKTFLQGEKGLPIHEADGALLASQGVAALFKY